MDMHNEIIADPANRRSFIGGSDARTIMGDDEAALLRLWREKRGEVRPRGPLRQPHCPAWVCDRTPQPPLVRTQFRPRLFAFTGLPKTYAWPSPIFGDEFDAGGLNCSLQLRTGFIRNPRAKSAFKSLDGREG